jgi:transcriptional regulator with XRE-family HTH domain
VLLAGVDVRARLGINVRRLREAKGWSQEDYADRAGIHRTYVSDIERGQRNPTVVVVEKLAGPLGVQAAELLA